MAFHDDAFISTNIGNRNYKDDWWFVDVGKPLSQLFQLNSSVSYTSTDECIDIRVSMTQVLSPLGETSIQNSPSPEAALSCKEAMLPFPFSL